MSLLIAILLFLAAWAALSLAVEKHFRALRRRVPTVRERKRLRIAGWSALLAACATCIAAHGWEFGPVYALVLLMLTALAWSLWLTRLTMKP